MKLRQNYQTPIVSKIRACFVRSLNYILAVLPTGAGKTVIFTFMAQQMSLKNKRAIILVHRIELLRQTSKALSKFDVDHGMINPNYTPNMSYNIQVASVQTIIRRLDYFAAANFAPDALVIDECHHSVSKSYATIIAHFKLMNPDLRIIGVTATPVRGDGQGLGEKSGGIFQEIVEGPQVSWLIEQGYLVRPRVFGTPEALDLSEIHTSMGDYKKDELASLVDKPKITGDAVWHYRELCDGVPAIVFCVSLAHAQHVAEQFQQAGYRSYSIDGSMDDERRTWLLNGLVTNDVQVLTTCDLISEGTDIPRATCSIELRPTKSKGLNMQQRGRVLRPVYADGYDLETQEGRLAAIAASEKPFAYILDHVGNSERHGLPMDTQEWSLDGVKKRTRGGSSQAPIKVQMCLSCFAVHEPAPACPECGHVNPMKDKTPKQVDGKLKELTPEALAIAAEKKKKLANIGMQAAKAVTLEEMKEVARRNGFNAGWANIQMSLKDKKESARVEKLAAKLKNQKEQEIDFVELPAMDLVETTPEIRNIDVVFEMVTAFTEFSLVDEFNENLDF